jgi:hypothetical protein
MRSAIFEGTPSSKPTLREKLPQRILNMSSLQQKLEPNDSGVKYHVLEYVNSIEFPIGKSDTSSVLPFGKVKFRKF